MKRKRLKNGDCSLLIEDAAPGNLRYLQVGAHYNMWCIVGIKNDDNQMGKHEACIYQYGKTLFFYCLNSKKRLKRPHRTLYHHVETLIPCGFSHVCPILC